MTTAKKLMIADELLAMPDDGNRHELVRGELIEMPPPGIMHAIVTGRIGMRMGHFIEENNLPFVYGPETAAHMERGPDTVRAADFGVISLERIGGSIPERGYVFGVVPDLVLETVSPDYRESVADARARMWLDAGARLVLAAYVDRRVILARRDDGAEQEYGLDDILTGDPVLPGFECPVAEIFATAAGQADW